MNSQSTPVHIRLWHHDFWRLAVANMLLTMSVYMFVPIMPRWLVQDRGFSFLEAGTVMGVYGLGLFILGVFVSFLVQRYRRNVVCIWAIAAMAAVSAILYYFDTVWHSFVGFSVLAVLWFVFGMLFGLAQMILTSTLIIDASESFQRTEANYSAAWFGRFSLSLGPLVGLLINRFYGFDAVLLCSAGCSLGAMLLIRLVNFPFRAPQDQVSIFSLDRFFLPHGFLLFINLLLVTLAMGLLFSIVLTEQFFAMLMAGFLLALLAQRFVFRDAELKSEVVSGLILLFAALLMGATRNQPIVSYASPVMIGLGLGIIGSRFLLFFIKLSRHCQRGTSQSTFLLGWESGIAWGLGFGLMAFQGQAGPVLTVAMALIIGALVMYHFTHSWFTAHKNR